MPPPAAATTTSLVAEKSMHKKPPTAPATCATGPLIGSTAAVSEEDSYTTDPARWGKLDDSVHTYWAKKGPELCQKINADISASEHQYKHQKQHFLKSSFQNGGNYFCTLSRKVAYFVLLADFLGRDKNCGLPYSKRFGSIGYSDWKHKNDCLVEHEGSEWHRITKQLLAYFRGHSETLGRSDNINYLGMVMSQCDPLLKAHIEKYRNAGKGNPSYRCRDLQGIY